MTFDDERNGSPRPGQVKEITSTSNPIIKQLKGLALKKNRDAEKVFMAEGLKLVTDALENGWKATTLVYGKEISKQKHLQAMAARARAGGALILEVSNKVLSAISRKDNPQMVIGVFEQQWVSADVLAKTASQPGDVLVALDRVRDPGNLGTIMRTADAAGAVGILLVDETTDPYSTEAVRATMGSVFNIRLARIASSQMVEWRKNFQGDITGTHLKGAVDYRTIDYTLKPNLIFMGNEQQGLPGELAALCDHLAFIPMAGKADSLNLAISTGIMLFEARRKFLTMPSNGTK